MRQPCADDVEFILRAAQHQPFPLEPKAKSNRHVMETHETHRPAAAAAAPVDGRSMDGRWTDGWDGRRGEEA
jgi:hypothetical protein